MNHKPWPLLILAFIHLIEPLSKIAFYSFFFTLSPYSVVSQVIENSTALQLFEFFLLFPIAGLAILAVKKWSLYVFALVQIWVLTINIPYLIELYQTNQLWLFASFASFTVLNISIVSYLLVPAVRIAYLDPRVRWWESKSRYNVNIDCVIANKIVGTIKNISESGAFIKSNNALVTSSNVPLDFQFSSPSINFHLKTNVLILHKFNVNNTEGYGARFIGLSKDNMHSIKALVKFLDKSNVERRPPHRNLKSLFQWLSTLLRTGKGLFFPTSLTAMRQSASV